VSAPPAEAALSDAELGLDDEPRRAMDPWLFFAAVAL
jgi:hypothetical protein